MNRRLVILVFCIGVALFIPARTPAFVFISAADTKTGVSTLTALSQRIVSLYPGAKLWVYPGDLQNKGFDPATISTWINAVNGGGANNLYHIIFPTRGNHDANNNYFPNAAAEWTSFFGSGANSLSAKVSAIGGSNWSTMAGQEFRTYSFDYDNSHFLGVDSWGGGDVTVINTEMSNWMNTDLTNAQNRGKAHAFLFWHGPLYYVDGHSSSTPANVVSVIANHPIVAATFHGHEHVDAYTYLDGSRVSGLAGRPIHQFVIGNAGAGNYQCNASRVDYCETYSGFGAIDVNGPNITVKMHDVQGALKYTKSFTHGTNVPTSTPTRTPTPGPSPTPPSGQAYRAFTDDSYWNTPFPVNAPIDSRNAEYIADSQNSSHTQNFLGFTAAPGNTQAFGLALYWGQASDPLYTLTDGKHFTSANPVQVHIPLGAQPQSGSDGEIAVFDLSTNQVIEMSGASFDGTNWHIGATLDRYMLSSNGLDSRVAGANDSRNHGHRGVPPSARGVRLDEVRAGAIRHRLECYWWATGTQTVNHYWPMAGDEGSKGGIVPEGTVIRIKPSVNLASRGLSAPALVIAKALQDYGCLVGDNSGSGNRLKLEINEAAWRNLGLTYEALSPIPWSDWEFIQGGYSP
ncbi:hypothetical protein A2576_00130 [Candidatus Amesbacteria bacterium RIFOXYD1_FULL_47_9]|uniref:Calcineurin-like phosphoesterase domain-containing protein n=1 Tax=Candidatus Amesbacteria bacterium RIFOXYD1_FULL_47_9 TaxID=1797267 RepID=A0A1F5A1M5_9BACT|nr:MAG: hypothetical protein A2576_00130 [Candidatus Amesbacteria bacterium RIFOXYD1_FULL_47_9]